MKPDDKPYDGPDGKLDDKPNDRPDNKPDDKPNDGLDNKYDKYDIIDFLEAEYIDDWLNLIPNNVWMTHKKKIENVVHKLSEPKIISYVIKKINLNLVKYIINNFEKINLNLIKYCFETNFDKLKKELINDPFIFNDIIKICCIKHNYDFNKYFYETIYFELKPEHKVVPKSENQIVSNPDPEPDPHPANVFYNVFYNVIKDINKTFTNIPTFDVFKYYNTKFKNIINSDIKHNYVFERIYFISKINNYNDLIELKNILNIENKIFNEIITNYDYWSDVNVKFWSRCILKKICMTGDLDYIVKILNLLDIDFIQKKVSIINIMTFVSLSNKIESVNNIYNFLRYEKNCVFTNEIYSKIIEKIILTGPKKYYEYDKIIYEFINLGGVIVIQGYSRYTDYIKKIKIKNIN